MRLSRPLYPCIVRRPHATTMGKPGSSQQPLLDMWWIARLAGGSFGSQPVIKPGKRVSTVQNRSLIISLGTSKGTPSSRLEQ